jgi:7,8-dihydropterin-6-yl-methyl-4-(beta-D-ribofuranosyl)aminobenzene 5'-phosphate synthase
LLSTLSRTKLIRHGHRKFITIDQNVSSMSLREIDKMSLTILMDNYSDMLLPSSSSVVRARILMNETSYLFPIAEHGFSAMIKICYNDSSKMNILLFDTGVSENGVIYNAELFGIDFRTIEAIILSHGHMDHCRGLVSVLKRMFKPTDIIVHPDAFLNRWVVFPDGKKQKIPTLDENELRNYGAILHKVKDASFFPLINDTKSYDKNKDHHLLMITGQIPRETSFEKGFPPQYKEEDNDNEKCLVPDPLVNDDQALVANIKYKGLVIITGCGHAGIINTINYAKKLSGINKIYAVLGGFHLMGDVVFQEAIEPTVNELQKADPTYIIPCHCTGWIGTKRIIDTMPEKFIQSAVGTTFNF